MLYSGFRSETHQDVDDSFSDDSSTWTTYSGPQGPVLDGVLLSELGAEEVDTPVGKTSL